MKKMLIMIMHLPFNSMCMNPDLQRTTTIYQTRETKNKEIEPAKVNDRMQQRSLYLNAWKKTCTKIAPYIPHNLQPSIDMHDAPAKIAQYSMRLALTRYKNEMTEEFKLMNGTLAKPTMTLLTMKEIHSLFDKKFCTQELHDNTKLFEELLQESKNATLLNAWAENNETLDPALIECLNVTNDLLLKSCATTIILTRNESLSKLKCCRCTIL